MCLKVCDQYRCLHRGPGKSYEYCIWQMRAKRMPGVEQTELTVEQNISRCASASTERYDYQEVLCPACEERSRNEEEDYQEKLQKQEEFRVQQRADSMQGDFDQGQIGLTGEAAREDLNTSRSEDKKGKRNANFKLGRERGDTI